MGIYYFKQLHELYKLGEPNVPILEPLIQSLINLNKRLIELGFSSHNDTLKSGKKEVKK